MNSERQRILRARTHNEKRDEKQKGVAMISALGVLIILGLLAGVFSAHMRLQSAYSARDLQAFKAHYIAVAGIQDAIARIEADPAQFDAYTDAWWTGESPEMTPLGEGGYTLTIADESARINIAAASAQTLSALLGGDKEATAAVVEFRSSKRPFVVEDLAGANLPADALSRVTTLGTTIGGSRININTAGAAVIAALPGIDGKAAQLLIDYRKGPDGVVGTGDDRVFTKPKDIRKIPGLTRVLTAPTIPLIKVRSSVFRIESVGSVYRGERLVANKKITAVLRRDKNNDVTVISWESS